MEVKERAERPEHEEFKTNHQTQTALKSAISLNYTRSSRQKDKKDLATVQLVFDRHTRATLKRLYTNGVLLPISQCLSTGKEANVYHSTSPDGATELAVKIYKTMAMSFRDREEYISGEFRFRRRGKQTRSNPHKLIKVWAEKEYRNLKRLSAAGVACPQPVVVRDSVLVMQFIGREGEAAPMLKDAVEQGEGGEGLASALYLKTVRLVRRLFVECRLVHGDLSEFNLLWWEGRLVVIDVSQTMERDHPMALEFLRRDIYNMNAFFRRSGVRVFRLQRVYGFITDEQLDRAGEAEALEVMMEDAVGLGEGPDEDEGLFMGQNLFRDLGELDPLMAERIVFGETAAGQLACQPTGDADSEEDEAEEDEDIEEEAEEEEEEEAPQLEPLAKEDTPVPESAPPGESDGEANDSLNSSESDHGDRPAEAPKGRPGDSKYRDLDKKERKRLVKEEKRLQRQTKMPKKLKRKLVGKGK